MKAISARVFGYGRFDEVQIRVDAPVVAIVGPNEVGKTTLLRALTSVEDSEPFEQRHLTDRRRPEPADVVVEVRYLLETQEAALAGSCGAANEPVFMDRQKRADGKIVTRFEPLLGRDTGVRSAARQRLTSEIAAGANAELLGQSVETQQRKNGRTGKVQQPLLSLLEPAVGALESDSVMLSQEAMAELKEARGAVQRGAAQLDIPDCALLQLLDEVLEREVTTPSALLADELEAKRPQMLMLEAEHREFRDEYQLSDLRKGPVALSNLLRLGGSTLHELRSALESEDSGRWSALERRLRERLRRQVGEVWENSDDAPEIHIGDGVVRVKIVTPEAHRDSMVSERSEGFKALVAMLAFVRASEATVPPVLLIDEAEQHLHYDAQAALVQIFEGQHVASKVIYTTHSAGCLPSDLAAVRAITPTSPDSDAGTARSMIKNHFWGDDPGFSPLLMLMGASALAFSPQRNSVIAFGEGASELILLPALFREVAHPDDAPFQVAPGLANVSRKQVTDLDLEAAKVAYLTDGDKAGTAILGMLREEQTPPDRMVQLPEGTTVEDLVRADLLAAAVTEALRRSSHDLHVSAEGLPRVGRWHHIEARCAENETPAPRKVVVARTILDLHDDQARDAGHTEGLLEPGQREVLESVYDRLRVALGLRGPELRPRSHRGH